MRIIALDPVAVGFQDRVIELGDPSCGLDVCRIFSGRFIALDISQGQEKQELVVQFVEVRINCDIGLGISAIDLLTIGCEHKARLVLLCQRVSEHRIYGACRLSLLSRTEEQLVFPEHITGILGMIAGTLLELSDRSFRRIVDFEEAIHEGRWLERPVNKIKEFGFDFSNVHRRASTLSSNCCFLVRRRSVSRSYSSTARTITTGRPYFSMATGSTRAVSISSPKPFFASRADIRCMIRPPMELL